MINPPHKKSTQTDAHSASLQTQLQQFVPYIEGPKMDWTVNDGLYHQFLKWKLKCKNIWIVNSLLCQRLDSARNSSHGQVMMEWT